MFNADRQTYLTQIGSRVTNEHPAQHLKRRAKPTGEFNSDEDASNTGRHRSPLGIGKFTPSNCHYFSSILGNRWLNINKICRRRNSTGNSSRKYMKLCGEQPPIRNSNNQHISSYLLERHLCQGERTNVPLRKEINIFNTSSAKGKTSNQEGKINIRL